MLRGFRVFRPFRPKPKFLTVKEIRELMRNGDDIPTSIFSAEKRDYIVKPRTILCNKGNKKGSIRY